MRASGAVRSIRPWLLLAWLALPAGAQKLPELPELPSGELDALRAVLDAEIDATDYDRVGVGHYLLLPNDTRRLRSPALDEIAPALTEATRELVASWAERNTSRLELWPRARRVLGERANKRAFLIKNRREIHAQFARAGWNGARDRALVYLELRPFEGAETVVAVWRVVARSAAGWQVLPGRHGFARGRWPVSPPGPTPTPPG